MTRLTVLAGAAIVAAAAWFLPIFRYDGILRPVEMYARVSLLAAGLLMLLALPRGRWKGAGWIFLSITGALGEWFVSYGVHHVVTSAVPGVHFGAMQPAPGLAALLLGYAICLMAGIRETAGRKPIRRKSSPLPPRMTVQPVPSRVIFAGRQVVDGIFYEVYSAPDGESARTFLSTRQVGPAGYNLVVETPEGNWGLDADGLYLEALQSWQADLGLATCDGEALVVGGGMHEVAVVRVRCGRCGGLWLDGALEGCETVARCPTCESFNRVWVETTCLSQNW